MEYHYEPAEKWISEKPKPIKWYIKYAWVFLEVLVIGIASIYLMII